MLLQLTEEQKRGRMERWLHMLRKFDVGRSERVRDIVTNNETFFFFLYTSLSRKPNNSLQSGFSQVRAHL